VKMRSTLTEWPRFMCAHHYVACDLGAESCRVILGTLTDQDLAIEEIHRFPNQPITVMGTLRWDVLRIFDELKTGLRRVAARGHRIESISTDSWGVDYVHVRGQEPMLTLPYHYRDNRTDGAVKRASAVVPADLTYSETGIQFLQFNTLYQLLDDLEHRPEILELSEHFLCIGDYFNYLLSGVRCAEESIASTTQLYNPSQRRWSQRLIENYHLPARAFPKVVPSGTKLGPLVASITDEVGLQDTQVVASCSHDTAAAVAAVPAEGQDWAYSSSGTWSLLGIEAPKPIIDARSREHNFTNELGYGGAVLFLKDIVGLWVVQECRREWAREGHEYTYDQLTEMAEEAEPLKSMIDLRDLRFAKPHGMPKKITGYCRETRQITPKTPGETIRCALESLALLYHKTLQEIDAVTGRKIKYLHIVGGGSRNQLLNQLSANACQLTVVAGPTEATAIGNILIQAIAMGHLGSLEDVRRIVRRSFPVTKYNCREESTWQEAYERFQRLSIKKQHGAG
jgi:rhamnulokinase